MDRECFSKLSLCDEQSIQNLSGQGGSDCLIKNKALRWPELVLTQCDLWPVLLNVKVKKFKEARVNGLEGPVDIDSCPTL